MIHIQTFSLREINVPVKHTQQNPVKELFMLSCYLAYVEGLYFEGKEILELL